MLDATQHGREKVGLTALTRAERKVFAGDLRAARGHDDLAACPDTAQRGLHSTPLEWPRKLSLIGLVRITLLPGITQRGGLRVRSPLITPLGHFEFVVGRRPLKYGGSALPSNLIITATSATTRTPTSGTERPAFHPKHLITFNVQRTMETARRLPFRVQIGVDRHCSLRVPGATMQTPTSGTG